MSQENVVGAENVLETPHNGTINGDESIHSPNNSENCEDPHQEQSYSGSPRSNRKIFVGALNPETTEQHLVDHFSQYGEIVSCAVKVCRETGYSRGFGFIVFKTDETVKKVLSIPEHIVNGKKIDPKPAKCSKDTQRKVFVGGLDPSVTSQEIEDHFNHYGRVEAVETPYDNIKNRRRTYAFVVFSSEHEARKAAAVERQEINGKSCDVRVAVPREMSLRQRSMAQAAQPQVTVTDIQQAMWNLFYYNTLVHQQPAFHNQFAAAAWQQTPHQAVQHQPQPSHHHNHHQQQQPNRTNFRASYDPQATEKLFSAGRPDGAAAAWYENASAIAASQQQHHRPHSNLAPGAGGVPSQGGPQGRSAAAAAAPQPAPTVAPYVTFPFPYQSAATAAAPHPFYYQATPGYFYQPPPTAAPAAVGNNVATVEGQAANGTAAAAQQQATAIHDFMAAIAANQAPYLAANTAASAYTTASDMGYQYRQQAQQQQVAAAAAFYPGVSDAATAATGFFAEASNSSAQQQQPPRVALLYGGQQQNNKQPRNGPSARSSSHVVTNGVPQHRPSGSSMQQNGHNGTKESSVAVAEDAAAANGTINNLESQMANLGVSENNSN